MSLNLPILDGQSLQIKCKLFFYLEIKEPLSVEHLIMSLLKLSWEINMIKWLMCGVLESYAINFALAMLHFNLLRVDKRHIIRS